MDEFSSVVDNAASTLQDLTAELALVRSVCDAIGLAQSMPELCTSLTGNLARTLGSQCVALYWSRPSAPFHLQALTSSPPLELPFPPSLADSLIIDTLRQARGPVLIGDLSRYKTQPQAWPFPPQFISFLLIPLVDRSRFRGLLCFCDNRAQLFNELKFLRAMSVIPPIVGTLSRFDMGQ